MKARYLLPCSCGRHVVVEATEAGHQRRCECGATLEVPSLRGLAELEPAPPPSSEPTQAASEAQAPRRSPRRTASRLVSVWGTRQRLLLVGTLVAVVGLAMASYLYIFRPRIVSADRLAPIQSWGLWRDLSHGLDQRPTWEEGYLAMVAWYRRWMVVALTITGVGVLVMVSSLFAPKKRRRRRVRRPPPGKPAPSGGGA